MIWSVWDVWFDTWFFTVYSGLVGGSTVVDRPTLCRDCIYPYTRFFWSMWRFKVAGKCLHTCAWYCSDTYENHIWILRPVFSTMVHIVPTLRTCSALGAFLCFAAIGHVTWPFATLEPWGHCTEFVGVLYKPTPMSKISRLTMTVIRTAGGGYECCFAWLGWTYVFHIASDWSCTVKSPVRC